MVLAKDLKRAPLRKVVNVQRVDRNNISENAPALITLDCFHTYPGPWKRAVKTIRRRCDKCLAGKKPDIRAASR